MNKERIEKAVAGNGMTSVGTLTTLLKSLIATKNLSGDVVELGCYRGITTRFMCETLQDLKSNKRVHVYDSFQGVPAKMAEDEGSDLDIPEGGARASFDQFAATFRGAHFPPPIVNEGWFEDTLPDKLPEKISVAFLDGDRYSSMKISLESVIPRMSEGGIIIMHDYQCLAGAKKAIDEHRGSFKIFHVGVNEAWGVI